ncbi:MULTISPECIES: type II toxin-antitoxin system ParD family antitoxin [Trichocoleus]|uniref:Type II toxin-antitoxin system ParD family antitoxin n=1 Tax=Trichocoleus desertorum GB2-A4 TaxID=2933944 RepID=A0ABV0J4L9_9CYAN|nr:MULTISPECIES: type II toxin-antitoxin system ParD family antitoxin [unclassified Trichocoleus]MBD1862061.1 type II toxin-antitoxin system ParD family antitoxin [Trichocoleus sp. FACHB-46]MBD2098678.1 type II toxin-antitoxin system ParD family antitoxin [Trichocoleus sp. FACHB-591]MBD2122869.1 type II toxin-antitoxin system ParD family antitoxin [Trichocoleus sp. FACHB-262]
MSTLNISLPEAVHQFVEEQVTFGGYDTSSEYIQHLIHQDQERVNKRQLETLLTETLESDELGYMTDEWWQEKRTQILQKLRSEQK